MGRGRAPCCDKMGLKKGPWTAAEDMKLIAYINKFGHQNWRALPKHAGLLRCGKSCRLRWINYLRPDLKRGNFTREEEETIIKLHELLGNKWSKIASCLPGRTDNEIKNVWNTHLKKRLVSKGPRASPINESNESSSNSYSSNSTISYCNHGEGESTHEEQKHLMIQPESPPEVSKMVHLEMLQEQKQSVEVKEIPIESCTDFWDMLEDDSILSSETADTEGKEDMWARHPKEQLVSERYSYGSISSSTSGSSPCSSYVLCSNEVDGIGSEEQTDALFKSKSTPTDDQDMISREVEQESSKKILEIYTEPERDFWSMLDQLDDDLCAFPSSDGAVDGSEGHQKTAPGEESKDGTDYGWTRYFENEPELWMIDNDNHQSLMKA